MEYPKLTEPEHPVLQTDLLEPPLPADGGGTRRACTRGRISARSPSSRSCPTSLELPVLLKVGDNVSTDEIMPAGSRVLPFRSNIPKISRVCLRADRRDVSRAGPAKCATPAATRSSAATNYGQGSSREHAALAPRYLGLRAVIAQSFARIHWQNLVNFGVLPFAFQDPADYDRVEPGDRLRLTGLSALASGGG